MDSYYNAGGGGGAVTSQIVGANGGIVEIIDQSNPYAGTKVEIPAGALSEDTMITIQESKENTNILPNVYAFELGPSNITFNEPVTVTIKYSDEYLSAYGITDESTLGVFVKGSSADSSTISAKDYSADSSVMEILYSPIKLLKTVYQDIVNNTITVITNSVGHFVVLRLSKEVNLLVPNRITTTLRYSNIYGVDIINDLGELEAVVGKGSLSDFYKSKNNLIVIHGFGSSPLEFNGDYDVIKGLEPYYDNIVSYMYPSGYEIENNATWLYNKLNNNASDGFQADIVAHSMGGLVARYMLEEFGNPKDGIRKLIMVATPNAGAPLADLFNAAFNGMFNPVLPDRIEQAGLIPGLSDLTDTEGVGPILNAKYKNNSVEYYLVAGDVSLLGISLSNDVVVPVSSVLSIPLVSPEEGRMFPPAGNPGYTFNHVRLHTEANLNGILAQIKNWILPAWSKTYGRGLEEMDEEFDFIQQTSDGGYIAIGETEYFPANGEGPRDILITKLNSHGNIEWQKTYDRSLYDSASSIRQTADGGYIASGRTMLSGTENPDAWILKLNPDGNIAWQKAYGGFGMERIDSLQETYDSGYIAAGRTTSFGAGNGDVWVIKLNSSGSIEWQKTYGGSLNEENCSIHQTFDGGYIVASDAYSPYQSNIKEDYEWIFKLNPDGTIAWQKKYELGLDEILGSIQQTSDGGYIVAGSNYRDGPENAWILKLNPDGTITWKKSYGSTGMNFISSIRQTSDDGYIAVGSIDSSNSNERYPRVLKLNSDGTIAWQKAYSSVGLHHLRSIQQTIDGGYIAAGSYVTSSGVENNIAWTLHDAWILKLNADGTCPPIDFNTNITPIDISATITNTTVSPQNTSATVTNTNTTVTNTNATVQQQAP